MTPAVDDLINVSDGPGQLGRLGHVSSLSLFFAQFVAVLPELFDFHAEFFEPRGDVGQQPR